MSEPSDADGVVAPPAPPPRDQAPEEGSRAVALLLAVAAVLAAIIASRAAFYSNDATSAWQSALRTELKRAALATADIDYVYQAEAEIAFTIETHRVRAEEARAEAARQEGEVAAALLAEAQVREGVIAQESSASEIVGQADYALEGGGYDLAKRLADSRSSHPEDIALDPVAVQLAGDEASTRALRLMMVTVPVGLCFLVGALAVPLRRWRRPLLATGWLLLALAVLLGIGVELGA